MFLCRWAADTERSDKSWIWNILDVCGKKLCKYFLWIKHVNMHFFTSWPTYPCYNKSSDCGWMNGEERGVCVGVGKGEGRKKKGLNRRSWRQAERLEGEMWENVRNERCSDELFKAWNSAGPWRPFCCNAIGKGMGCMECAIRAPHPVLYPCNRFRKLQCSEANGRLMDGEQKILLSTEKRTIRSITGYVHLELGGNA